MVMSLPMVTCPLCCRPGFSSSESLCTALVDVTTRSLSCPICNCQVSGLDKLTVHLFSHSLDRLGQVKAKETKVAIETSETCFTSNKCSATTTGCASFYNNKSFRDIFTEELHSSVNNKEDFRASNSGIPLSSFIPNDTALIYLRSDNGQLFAIASENINPNLKNLTINTQNYITSTNITTSTLQTNVVGNMQKRKYCDVFDKDSSFSSTNAKSVEQSPEMFTTGESVLSYPSTPSVSSETDRCSNNERVFESCKDLLAKGDFSTNCNDLSDQETNDSNLEGSKCEQRKEPNSACDVCSYVFPNKTILAMHNQLVHKKNESEVESKRKSLVCNLCSRTFSLRSSLMIHRRVAHAGGFGNNDNTISNKLPSLNVCCQVCGKYFTKDIYLSQHMKVHDEKQWQCTICAKGFTTKYFLKKHRRLHTGEMPYRCKTCSKSFTFQQTYRKHLLYHNNDKPYCCTQCGRLFKELSTLHNHERIHSGEKPFTCETCGKAFRQRVSYLVHRRIHTGAMPYKCTACNKSFRYKISQRTHKCTSQPPGIVVRAQGYLVHRLQAAMNKAAGEAKTTETNIVSPDSRPEIHPFINEPKVTTCSQNKNDETPLKSPSHKAVDVNKTERKSDVSNSKLEKPQIYLLVKGSNGETYYQPLILTQNVVQPPPAQVNMAIVSCDSSKSLGVNAKDGEEPSIDIQMKMSREDTSAGSNHEFTNYNLNSSSLLNSRNNEIMNCALAPGKEIVDDDSSSNCRLQNRGDFSKPSSDKSLDHNDISSGVLSELFESLTSADHQNEETTHRRITASENRLNSDHSTESSDLFSLMLSPSSSIHDRYGCMSTTFSPNTSANQSDKVEALSLSALNDAPQSSFFESFSDDTLKELLFGEVK